MSVHNLQSGACETCGGWTGRAQVRFCLDCKRVAKRRTKVPCSHEGCTELFHKLGTSKYCVLHRGLRRAGGEL